MESSISIQQKAANFRKKNCIGEIDPIIWPGLLGKLEILTIFRPMSDAISGIVGELNGARFLLINSNHSKGRQHFTIAHEMYHLFYDESFHHALIDTKDLHTPQERSADAFAAQVLLPEAGILDFLGQEELKKNSIRMGTLFKLEQFYQCSRFALLIRLKKLGLIGNDFIEKFQESLLEQAYIHGFDDCLYKPGNEGLTIGSYGTLAKSLFDHEIISESNCLDMLLDIGINSRSLTIEDQH